MPIPAPIPWTMPILQLDPASLRPVPGFLMGKEWGNWLSTSIVQQVANTPQFYPAVSLTNQSASIGTTPIPLPQLAAGVYRVSTYARITTADPLSSSLTVTIGWTESGVTLSFVSPVMNGNTVTTVQSTTAILQIDASSPISYTTTYVSTTPGAMKYKLIVLVETTQS